MPNPKAKDLERTVASRVSAPLFEKIRKFQDRLAKKQPGVRINQSDAIRVLLEQATAAEKL